ncbi:DUF2388 domain-containing protein [Pseudoxanthomonas sp. NC8]|nr:DUF2388 domain-containing protein [Pseudoxanthomonas sp. NC8]
MKSLAIPASLLLCAFASAAPAGSFAGTTAGSASGASSAGSSASSDSSSGGDKKLVREAREDAAGFVASNGKVRSARLEAALRVMREQDPSAREASDLALARAILAGE